MAAAVATLVFSTVQHALTPTAAAAQTIDDKVLYLTYDDGPHPSVTPQILDLLDEYDAKVTFFVVGDWVGLFPDIVADAHRRGHSIQNHTWNHPHLTRVSDDEIVEQISLTQERIVEVTGETPTCLRPPFGDTDARVEEVIASQGLTQTLWDVSAQDWRQPGVEVIVDAIIAGAQPGSNILLHDGPFSQPRQQGVDATRQLLDHYSALGYRFEVLPQCGAGESPGGSDPHPPQPPGPPPAEPVGDPGPGGGTLTVRAAGASGEEIMQISVDGEIVDTFTASNSPNMWRNPNWQTHTYTHPEDLSPSQIRVLFTNDGQSATGTGRDVRVDYITINGTKYETEDPTVQSTGSWGNGARCTAGNWRVDNLVCNGHFEFKLRTDPAVGDNVSPTAVAGDDLSVTDDDNSGFETVLLDGGASSDRDGSIVGFAWSEGGTTLSTSAAPSLNLAVGTHELTLTVTDDDGGTGSDSVVVIVDAGADSPPPPGPPPAEPVGDPGPGGGTLTVRAAGASGEEIMQISVDGEVVDTFTASNSSNIWRSPDWQTHTYTHPDSLSPSQIRILFTNDGQSAAGTGRDVRVDYITINGTKYETEDPAVESTGSWGNGARCTAGNWRVDNLVCNGHFGF